MFQNAGMKAYHYSDEEDQVIFWGPDVDRRHIALVRQIEGEYHVLSRTGMTLFKGEFAPVVQWIIAHHRQYSNQLYNESFQDYSGSNEINEDQIMRHVAYNQEDCSFYDPSTNRFICDYVMEKGRVTLRLKNGDRTFPNLSDAGDYLRKNI